MEVTVLVQDDPSAEDDEEFFVYLVPQTEGVRTARPSQDNGRKVSPCYDPAYVYS